jgi:hypothetical protein
MTFFGTGAAPGKQGLQSARSLFKIKFEFQLLSYKV